MQPSLVLHSKTDVVQKPLSQRIGLEGGQRVSVTFTQGVDEHV